MRRAQSKKQFGEKGEFVSTGEDERGKIEMREMIWNEDGEIIQHYIKDEGGDKEQEEQSKEKNNWAKERGKKAVEENER